MKQYCGILLHLTLLAISLVFVERSIKDYLSNVTSYSVSREHISLADLPTLTMCLQFDDTHEKFVYGKDFVIDFKLSERKENSVALTLNKSLETIFSVVLHLSELRQARLVEQEHETNSFSNMWQCYKLSPTWNGREELDFANFSAKVGFTFSNASDIPDSIDVWVTSEQNSYGIVQENWFDGKVEFPSVTLYPRGYINKVMKIVEVTEYQNIESLCSHDSYFECLAKRFVKLDSQSTELSNCQSYKICSPFSLPFGKEDMIPLCQNNNERNCFERLLMKIEEDQQEHCKQSCRIMEFRTEYDMRKSSKLDAKNKCSLEYKFALPQSSTNLRFRTPFKVVKTEYFVMSWMALVGTVGGTMGMFVGFSVFGTFEMVTQAARKSWDWVKSKTKFF